MFPAEGAERKLWVLVHSYFSQEKPHVLKLLFKNESNDVLSFTLSCYLSQKDKTESIVLGTSCRQKTKRIKEMKYIRRSVIIHEI